MEYLVFGAIALVVVVLLLWQEQKRRKVKSASVIEAPVAQRSLIATVVVAGPAVLSYSSSGTTTKLDLGQPFALDATIRVPLLPSRLRGDPSMIGVTALRPREPSVFPHTARHS